MFARLNRWLRGENGAIAPFLALMLIPIIGMVALGGEVSGWYMKERQLQNAADAAAIAAATNANATNVNGVPGYQREAIAAAGQYGYQTKTNGDVVVTPSQTDCPGSTAGANDCFEVIIRQRVPLYLTAVIGYRGNTTMAGATSGAMATYVAAAAVASPKSNPAEYCMVGLAGSGDSFRINGGNSVDFKGCSIHANSDATCNGTNSDLNMLYGDASGTSSCGHPARSGQPALVDPYLLLDANPPIPNVTCGAITNTTVVATASIPSGGVCGTAQLTADIDVTTPNTTLTIYNGSLDLNGHTLKTSGSGSLSIILTGTAHTSGQTWNHTITGSGTIDITAPTSGTAAISGGLKGVAILQDSRMNGSKDNNNISAAGNQPNIVLSGLIYVPNSDFTIKGAIDHRSGYLYCIAVVANHILASGTGSIYANSSQDCHVGGFLGGLDVPGTAQRQRLVQ